MATSRNSAVTDDEPRRGAAMDRAGELAKWILLLAAAYNLLWGAWVVLLPGQAFSLVGMEPPRYPQIWQCVGMIVGVYGIGYAIAAFDARRHWPIVLVGLLGKVFGPIGFVGSALAGDWPWSMGWFIITNDLIWWIPFGWILWLAWKNRQASAAIAPHGSH